MPGGRAGEIELPQPHFLAECRKDLRGIAAARQA